MARRNSLQLPGEYRITPRSLGQGAYLEESRGEGNRSLSQRIRTGAIILGTGLVLGIASYVQFCSNNPKVEEIIIPQTISVEECARREGLSGKALEAFVNKTHQMNEGLYRNHEFSGNEKVYGSKRIGPNNELFQGERYFLVDSNGNGEYCK